MNRNSIKDVAKRAGVSIATVSRVINQTAKVEDKKVQAVKEAMKFYNYTPNQLGRGLVKQTTEMIGVYFPYTGRSMFENTFYLELLKGIDDALKEEKYNLLLINENEHVSKEALRVLQYIQQRRIDGVLLNGMTEDILSNPNFMKLIEDDYPMVYIGKQIHQNGRNVYAQYEKYMKNMLDIFYNFGHRKIFVMLEDRKRNLNIFDHIKDGFSSKHEDVEIEIKTVRGRIDKEQINNLLKDFLLGRKGTAVFAYDTENAAMVINFCMQYNLNIPEDVSLISVEHRSDGGMDLFPPISCFYVPAKDMGYCAAEMLVDFLKGRNCKEKIKNFDTVYKDRNSVKDISKK